MATLLMSSWIMTVLPTPAPPKRPVLPPFVYGSSRSMTLMPVSNISTEVACSSYAGGSRWIGQRSLAFTGPRPSIGSPMTFRMRPSVSLPTGTEMGAPRSTAVMPRTMPSVGFIETQRATDSPSC